MATLASDLGANPYDQFVRAVHERFSISIGLARLIFAAIILVIAFAFGGALGAGTVALDLDAAGHGNLYPTISSVGAR